jgi:RNA polymerase sigma factor (sigma-70 family)
MRQVMAGRSRGAPPEPASTSGDLDGSLLVRARTESAPFGEFYARNHPGVIRYFMRKTACPHTAAELTAETFAEALAGVGRFDPARGKGTSWLYGIAVHQFHQWLRRGEVDRRARRRLAMSTPRLTDDDIGRIEAVADLEALLPSLQDAMGRLRPKTRLAVELRILRELPYVEVASALGCSEGNARLRVARGLKGLAGLLEAS